MNATTTQQSTSISVNKTHSVWHAWDVTSSLSLRPESECLSKHSVGTACSTSEQSSLDVSISPGCTLFLLADDTVFVYMDSYLHQWKSSISAASINEKTLRFFPAYWWLSIMICMYISCVYIPYCFRSVNTAVGILWRLARLLFSVSSDSGSPLMTELFVHWFFVRIVSDHVSVLFRWEMYVATILILSSRVPVVTDHS